MDAFEQVVSEILWNDGHWVRTSVKVELTKEEKRLIGRATSPRWELDIVGYAGRENVVRVVECKSYLDSAGVGRGAFDGSDAVAARRFKLFNDGLLRDIVLQRLRQQLHATGACAADPEIRLCLACGKIRNDSRSFLAALFAERGWELWDEPWLAARLARMANGGYENQVASVVAKLLLRAGRPADPADR